MTTPTRRPRTPSPSVAVKSSAGRSTLVASIGSLPQMTLRAIAHSSTVLENGPIWSSEEAKATIP